MQGKALKTMRVCIVFCSEPSKTMHTLIVFSVFLVFSKPRKTRKRKVSKAVHDGLAAKLNDSFQGFGSYVEAVQWVKENYGVSYPYNTLRDYMIAVFGTKIKQPRKSHIKKDTEAQADFLKLT